MSYQQRHREEEHSDNRARSDYRGSSTLGTVAAVGGAIAAAVLAVGAIRSFTVVPAGYVKVVDFYGKVSEQELDSGLKFGVNPLASRIPVDVKTKEHKESMKAPTNEGLLPEIDLSIFYHVSPDKADQIYKTVGLDYEEKIITPTVRNIARDIIAEFASEDLYTEKRTAIGEKIYQTLNPMLEARGIVLEEVLLRDLKLPATVTNAITLKMKQKQEAEQMQYVLETAKKEAERVQIEAQGLADSQRIISDTLTTEYLRFSYIQTLEDMIDSPNTEFVFYPLGANITPLLPIKGDSIKAEQEFGGARK